MWFRRPGRAMGVGAVALVLVSCTLTTSLDGFSGHEPADDEAGDGDSGRTIEEASVTPEADAPDGADAGPCAALHPPAMILAGKFCIDATEVTKAHYASFLQDPAANSAPQPAECAWNTNLAPDDGPYCPDAKFAVTSEPVVCVDWCDARAYCAWAGKRLCGKIGGGPADFGSATGEQWLTACTHTSDALHQYPSGNSYVSSACNDGSRDAGKTVDVASLSTCVGPYPGLFDMGGNVTEWIDRCDNAGGSDHSADACFERGANFTSTPTETPCVVSGGGSQSRVIRVDTLGFRCCKDL